jgi:hypothetical protein
VLKVAFCRVLNGVEFRLCVFLECKKVEFGEEFETVFAGFKRSRKFEVRFIK